MATPEKLRCFSRPSRDKNHSLGEIFKVCRQGHALQEGHHYDIGEYRKYISRKEIEADKLGDENSAPSEEHENDNPGDTPCQDESVGELPNDNEAKGADEELEDEELEDEELEDEELEDEELEDEDQNGFPIETLEELPEDISSESWNLILSEESATEDAPEVDNNIETNTQFSVEADGDPAEMIIEEYEPVGDNFYLDLSLEGFDETSMVLDGLERDLLEFQSEEMMVDVEENGSMDEEADTDMYVSFNKMASTNYNEHPLKLVDYSFSDEDSIDSDHGRIEDELEMNVDQEDRIEDSEDFQEAIGDFDFDADSSVIWSVSDCSDKSMVTEDEPNDVDGDEYEINEKIPEENSNDIENEEVGTVPIILSPSSEPPTNPSPRQNRDLLTPPSQPSSAPSSPPSAPCTPSASGPRTPRMETPTGRQTSSRLTVGGYLPDSSPFRRPSNTGPTLPLPASPTQTSSEVSMRGALTHRLNKLVVTNKTRHPVPDYLKEELMENNRERGVKFTLSHLMNDQMLLDSYILKKNKGPIERKKGVTINWQCVSQNCYFRATTVDAFIEKTNGTHNHDPTVELFSKREGRVKLKEAVALSDAPLASIVLNVVAGTAEDAHLTAHGSNAAMKQCARRFKQSQYPELGKQLTIKDLCIDPLWFEIRPGSNETLLLFDNGAGKESEVEGSRILVFGSKVHLNLLLRSLDWMGDGTFDVCPYIGKEKFYQLYTIAGFVRTTAFTLLRVLMQKKDAKSYKELFSFLLKSAVDNGWQFKMVEEGGNFLTDFEVAPHLAKNKVLSNTPMIRGSKDVGSLGCNFHFCSGIMKDNNVKQRMKHLYDKSEEHRTDVRMLMMLVYVPPSDIPRVYDVVCEHLKGKKSQAVQLFPRLTKYFVHGYERPSDKTTILPRFPPSMWSCMSRVLADKPCTTNFLEGSHRGYDFKFMKNHPSFKDFGSCLAKDIRGVEKDIGLVQEGQENLVQRKRKQELERTAAIKTSCMLYSSEFTKDEILDYTKNLAKITSRTLKRIEEDEVV